MKSVLMLILAFQGTLSFASTYEPNTADKLDSYTLKFGTQKSGKVTVQATVGDEPMIAPVEITFKLQCLRGFNAKNFKKTVSWQTYDYGNAAKVDQLSTYDANKQVITVFFRTAKVDSNEQVVPDKLETRTFNVKDACTPN